MPQSCSTTHSCLKLLSLKVGRLGTASATSKIYDHLVLNQTSIHLLAQILKTSLFFFFFCRKQLTFGEYNCRGKGSNTAKRVKWANKLSGIKLKQLTSISFIDSEGWMRKLAFNILGA